MSTGNFEKNILWFRTIIISDKIRKNITKFIFINMYKANISVDNIGYILYYI